MKFTTPKDKILNAVLMAEKVVGKKESLPVLSCILLEVDKELHIRATNLESAVSVRVQGEVEEKGVVAVPSSIFSQTLRFVPGDKVSLAVEGGNLVVASRGSRTLIKAIPHDEFPPFDTVGTKSEDVSLPRSTLVSTLQSVTYAASSSMIRPELGSIYVSVKDGILSAVATDSFRLAEKTVPNVSKKGSEEVLIPLKHVQELLHVLDKLSVEEVGLLIDDSQLVLQTDTLRFVSRIIDGTFPNYKEIVPKTFTTEVTLLKGDFTEALRKARVFSGSEQHVGFHVYPKKKVFDITAQSAAIGEMSDSLEAAVSGEDIDVNFHIGYIADCLQSIPSDSIKLGFSGAGKPLVIRGISDTTFMYLVMPLNR